MNPSRIVDKMMSKDEFSQWLGIERIEEGAGFSKLRMVIRPDMCNGFGIAHGGIMYSFADSALAFASNARGRVAVSIETSISHIKSVGPGEILTARTEEIHSGNRISHYVVHIVNGNNEPVAFFRGTVFVKDQLWEGNERHQ